TSSRYRNAPMISLIAVLSLLVGLSRADSFLRLCSESDSIHNTVIPECVARAARQELRELTDEERTWVVDAFRKERAVAPRQQWENILDPPGVYQLIERLDTRLASRHLSLPYWDTSIELRLNQPGDSILFHPSFLLRSRRRRDRRLNPVVRPKTRFERRIRNPRDDKTARRLQSQRTRKLLKAIRRHKQSELLFLLFEMGDLFTRISTPLACPTLSSHLSCSSNSSSPLPMLSPSARCSSTINEDNCYKSHCIADICTVVIETPIPTVPRTTVSSTTIPLTTAAPTTVTPPTVEPTLIVFNETEPDNSTHVHLASVDGVATLSDDVVQLLSSREATTPSTTTVVLPLTVKKNRSKQNGWYRNKPKSRETTTTTTSVPKKRDKVPRRAPDNSDEEMRAPSLHFAAAGKLMYTSDPSQRDLIDFRPVNLPPQGRHVERSQHSEMDLHWQSPTFVPQVFIPITVIEGPWRGPHRIKRSEGAKILANGMNSPIGYTSSTHGHEVNGSSALFIINVPDPELSGPIVEFNITVTDK
ncbi:hypothetical protein PFISCL1PPCAC_9924, partial [Pristionchus fissidentatus]